MIWNKMKQAVMVKSKAKPKAKKRTATKTKTARKTQIKRTTTKKQTSVPARKKRQLAKQPRKRVPTITAKKSSSILGKVTTLATVTKHPIARLTGRQDIANIEGRLAVAFKQLHTEFSKREQQLEVRMQELKLQHDRLLEHKQNRRKWLIPLAFAVAVAGGYMLYVLTSMQHSMTSMTGSMGNMNQYMSSMSSDTQVMSQNIQMMNRSMYNMNGNVQQMSQAMEPMANVASAASPFTKMFKSMMPF